MATNKFATKLSRNTNRITLILVYALLEWLLMFFIFLNSLFTYFLVKFASFFGLKQVCVLCPNINRIFEQNPEARFSYKHLLCESHILELASLTFCKTHRKQLSESVNLCSDCSSDHEERSNLGLGFCDCCQKSLGDKPFLNYLLLKSSIWGNSLGNRENEGFLLEMIDDDKIGDGFDEKEIESDQLGFFNEADKGKKQEVQNGEVISDVESYGLSLKEVSEEDGFRSNVVGKDDDDSVKIIDRFEHEFDSCETERLIPVKLIDSSTIINLEGTKVVSEDEQSDDDHDHHHHDQDDDTSNADTFVEDKTSEIEEEKDEQEEEQFGANKLTCKLKNEVENLSNGFDPLLADSENDDEEETIERKLEEKLPKTPILAKKLLILTKNEYEIGEDDVVDDPIKTIERLKEIVKAEEEALRGLYAELEEERSASAIATNQTMAMITRLQEEKAKVQMEALQYQRMMEEQAEYDQEALQLLNHLMVKREKEKEELKKELEVYKEKVFEYESKAKKLDQDEEKDNNGGDQEDQEDDDSCENDVDLEKVTMDCVKHMSMLDESLSEFEEERLVILDQLKVLEDKLLTMQENESAEDSKFHGEFSNSNEENERNADLHEYSEGITMASMAKSLLPLLDAAENESEDGFQELPESINLSSESEKLEIIKQVDSVYERLQVLETDGDKGTNLLQDILQHLRDLRTIELSETVENQTNHDE